MHADGELRITNYELRMLWVGEWTGRPRGGAGVPARRCDTSKPADPAWEWTKSALAGFAAAGAWLAAAGAWPAAARAGPFAALAGSGDSLEWTSHSKATAARSSPKPGQEPRFLCRKGRYQAKLHFHACRAAPRGCLDGEARVVLRFHPLLASAISPDGV